MIFFKKNIIKLVLEDNIVFFTWLFIIFKLNILTRFFIILKYIKIINLFLKIIFF